MDQAIGSLESEVENIKRASENRAVHASAGSVLTSPGESKKFGFGLFCFVLYVCCCQVILNMNLVSLLFY